MGPTNVALVKLFQADQAYRQAQARYDAAAKDVRIQERKLAEIKTRLDAAAARLKELQAHSANTDLDIKSRETRIERLRQQQQTAKNNKEYQAFLIEINTEKVDKAKIEDELLKLMEQVESAQGEQQQLAAQLEAETQKLGAMREKITERLTVIKQEVDSLEPARNAAAEAVSATHREAYMRLADRFDGEAMAPVGRPDRRVEEYACGACNMSLVVDIYNRLHSRDEVVFCPSCRRMLFIPDDLPIENAIKQRKKPKASKNAESDAAEAPAQ